MKKNDVITETHCVREEVARECGYDAREHFRRMRPRTEQLKAQGWQVVSFAPREKETAYSLREEPPEQQ